MTARQVSDKIPELKKEMGGAGRWTNDNYTSTVGKHGGETAIANNVIEQGCESEYLQINKDQLRLL